MRGFSYDYSPFNASQFLFVRIKLSDPSQADTFEERGQALLPVFEKETRLTLVLSGRTEDNQFLNLWRFRPEDPPDAEADVPVTGGTRDLLRAMGIVHHIPEYGPVDDLVAVEDQDLMGEFLTRVDGEPEYHALPEAPDYYCLFEYRIDSGEAGTFSFDLRAYLGGFEDATGWRCVVTCFPMTGALNQYVQLFHFRSSKQGDELRAYVKEVRAQIPWEPPEGALVLAPTAYDRAREQSGGTVDYLRRSA